MMDKVYIVMARGNDYYDEPQPRGVYRCIEEAKAEVNRLKVLPSEWEYEELEYTEVFVDEWKVN